MSQKRRTSGDYGRPIEDDLPLRPTSDFGKHMSERLRVQHLAHRLHRLGPRALYEFILELGDRDAVLVRLEDYARMDPDILRGLGGDRFPHLPLRIVS